MSRATGQGKGNDGGKFTDFHAQKERVASGKESGFHFCILFAAECRVSLQTSSGLAKGNGGGLKFNQCGSYMIVKSLPGRPPEAHLENWNDWHHN